MMLTYVTSISLIDTFKCSEIITFAQRLLNVTSHLHIVKVSNLVLYAMSKDFKIF